MNNKDVAFVKLSNQEILSKFTRLTNSETFVRIWKKGSEYKENFKIISFDKDKFEIEIIPENNKTEFNNQNILFTFELKGLQFFSTGILKFKDEKNLFVIEIIENVYKCDRRINFRVLTDLVYNVFVEFKIPIEVNSAEFGNVIDLKTGIRRTGYTGIFKKFLEMVGERNSEEGLQAGSFRVADISMTGLSLYLGDAEKKYFETNQVFSNITINFEKEEYLIDEMKLVYLVDYLHSDNLLKKYRAGFHFTKIDQKVSSRLYTKLFHSVKERQIDQLFEDKIK